MDWYEKWFGQDYLDVYTHRSEKEAEEFINTLEKILSLQPEQKLLDLCCGTGRYSLALAQRGYVVTGLDLSSRLIDFAKKRSKELGVKVDFIVRDMRDIPFSGYFDGILNMFTSFGYFETDSENEKVIMAASNALKKDGWFVLDYLNRENIIQNFQEFDEQKKENVLIQQKRKLNFDTNRIEKVITITRNDSTKEYSESVKMYSHDDLEQMYRINNIRLTHKFGNYDGTPLDNVSPRAILIGRKM
ncbi:class I SAM-dependent methyltransferase [candidate division KSB1 bacterium]|nr:class I SAM-dependent methyltransferase [candidate division KSB1 bacterium]